MVTITAYGQQPPSAGNDVMVKLEVELPRDVESTNLHKELRFNDTLTVMRRELYLNWGINHNGKAIAYFNGKTWKKAVKNAAKYVKDELDKLQIALHEREEALKNAGDWV